MTQQPFSRPGAIDLSGLKSPAPGSPQPPAGGRPAGPPSTGSAGDPVAGGARSSYAVDITEENLQTVLDASVTAPVVLVFYSLSR